MNYELRIPGPAISILSAPHTPVYSYRVKRNKVKPSFIPDSVICFLVSLSAFLDNFKGFLSALKGAYLNGDTL